MKKVATFLAGAVGVVMVAMLLPANVFANCPNPSQIQMSVCSGGGEVLLGPSSPPGTLSGQFWIQGQGNPANDLGVDSGIFTGLAADGQWLNDFSIPGSRCLEWDWQATGTDGCPDGSAPLWVSVSDGANLAMVASAGFIGAGGVGNYDFSFTNNGVPAPNFGGSASGLQMGRAVHVSSASASAGHATLNIAALTVPKYDENGGSRPYPGTVQMRGRNNAVDTVQTGSGAKSITVDNNTDVCWEIADGALVIPLGCVHVGSPTPSQNVLNAKATLGHGQLKFSWDVSAQFDVLGFNVIQKNATKGTERKVNDSLIPINGMNDTNAASYAFSAGRKDLKANLGGFEIELVRTNGETSRTPVSLR